MHFYFGIISNDRPFNIIYCFQNSWKLTKKYFKIWKNHVLENNIDVNIIVQANENDHLHMDILTNYYIRKKFLFSSVSNGELFYKQKVYKQLALRRQIAKQLSVLNPVSISNNKNYRLRKSGVFPL